MHTTYKSLTLTTYKSLTVFAITTVLSALLPFSTKAQNKAHPTSPITATQSTPFNPTNTQQMIEYFVKLRDSDLPAWLRSMLSSTTHHQSPDHGFARATWLAQLHMALPQNSQIDMCFGANGVFAPKINLTGGIGFSARISIPKFSKDFSRTTVLVPMDPNHRSHGPETDFLSMLGLEDLRRRPYEPPLCPTAPSKRSRSHFPCLAGNPVSAIPDDTPL